MSRKRLSRFPLHKPFEKQPPTSDLSQVVLRLIVGFFTPTPYIVGTATLLCGYLAVTARHVIEEVLNQEATSWSDKNDTTVSNRLTALQIVSGDQRPQYMLWDVVQGWACPHTDLAFLNLAANPHHSDAHPRVEWKQPFVRSFPPEVGSRVAAFGYRNSSIRVTQNHQGGFHYDISDDFIASVGEVRQIFETQRDSVLLNFPCFRLNARFDGGMSGGAVFDETGALCGLICASVAGSHDDGEPMSYACSLWPMFQTMISGNRGAKYPKNVAYPALELATAGLVQVSDYDRLIRQIRGKV